MLAGLRDPNVIVLKGNHEAALVEVCRGDQEALAFWLRFGGWATVAGLGIDQNLLAPASAASIFPRLQTSLRRNIVDWLADLPHSWTLGDYFFVHAGIKPGVKLRRQDRDDFLWIRKPFLTRKRLHEKVIIHGHAIEPGLPCLGGNRIGIDTGAHEHGCLTALGLEYDAQWLLQSADGRTKTWSETLG
jgi:serine/threonine protein phosphatase 1